MGNTRDINQIKRGFCPKGAPNLGQWFSTGAVLLPTGHLAMSGDTTECLVQSVNSAKVEKPWSSGTDIQVCCGKVVFWNLEWLLKSFFRGTNHGGEDGWERKGHNKCCGVATWNNLKHTRKDKWFWVAGLVKAVWMRPVERGQSKSWIGLTRALAAKLRSGTFKQRGKSLWGFKQGGEVFWCVF